MRFSDVGIVIQKMKELVEYYAGNFECTAHAQGRMKDINIRLPILLM
jgi:hypothetical protein